MTALGALMRRDIRIALRVGGGALIGVLFFLTVVVLMPFAVGPDLALLTRLGPAILWLGALLASLLTLDRLFMADAEDGSLDLPAAYLSAGQRRRLSVARLLAVRRPVWLLDEPTTALDTAGQAMFAGLMRDHLAGGGLIIAATHGPLGIAARELRIGAGA